MTLTAERYARFVEAIAAAAGIDELTALRNEIRRAHPRDERTADLEQMIDARARDLLDTIHDADGAEE